MIPLLSVRNSLTNLSSSDEGQLSISFNLMIGLFPFCPLDRYFAGELRYPLAKLGVLVFESGEIDSSFTASKSLLIIPLLIS